VLSSQLDIDVSVCCELSVALVSGIGGNLVRPNISKFIAALYQ